MDKTIYGYKTFDEDLKSLFGNQFEICKTYEIEEDNLKIRINGFHFCKDVYDIFKYYRPKIRKIRICKIEAENIIIKDEDKSVTNKITIIEEINYKDEFLNNFINEPYNEKNYLGALVLSQNYK